MATRSFDIRILLPAVARTATATGAGVDLQGYINPGEREMKAFLDVGAYTSGTLDVKIQDSDDNTTYTDISGAVFAQRTAVGNETIHFRTNKRYVRAVGTGGSSPSFAYGCYLLVERRLV